MGADTVFFLEILEWLDDTGTTLVYRLPESGSADIKYGAQLTVRESQAAVFFYNGKAVGAFGPGRHTLKTANIPVLTKIASLPWGLTSPLRAEVYFTNLKTFTNMKWGTRDPVAFKDRDLGLVRLRAFGIFNFRIVQPVLFINRITGTQGLFTTEEIGQYLNRVIVSRFNDYMGEAITTIFDLPSQYDELAKGLTQRVKKDFSALGLGLTQLYVNAITPPPEVQKAIDDKSRMGVFEDMNKLMQMKTAMAMEKIAENDGGMAGDGAGAGVGMVMGSGMGMMLPGLFAGQTAGASPREKTAGCEECRKSIPSDANFCPWCGHQQVVFEKCTACGKNMTPGARFCPRCGTPAGQKDRPWICGSCGTENLTQALFCNQCGEKH